MKHYDDSEYDCTDALPPDTDDHLTLAEYWLIRGSDADSLTHSLIDVAESLRRIARHLDGQEAAQ